MVDELERPWKDAVVAYFLCCPSIFQDGLIKSTTDLSQNSRYPGRDLNPGPLKYEVSVNHSTKTFGRIVSE
jgi:hypothetical protein